MQRPEVFNLTYDKVAEFADSAVKIKNIPIRHIRECQQFDSAVSEDRYGVSTKDFYIAVEPELVAWIEHPLLQEVDKVRLSLTKSLHREQVLFDALCEFESKPWYARMWAAIKNNVMPSEKF